MAAHLQPSQAVAADLGSPTACKEGFIEMVGPGPRDVTMHHSAMTLGRVTPCCDTLENLALTVAGKQHTRPGKHTKS